MKQSIYETFIFIIVMSVMVTGLAVPFYYLRNWLFVKSFLFNYIIYLESVGIVSFVLWFRFIAIKIKTPK